MGVIILAASSILLGFIFGAMATEFHMRRRSKSKCMLDLTPKPIKDMK